MGATTTYRRAVGTNMRLAYPTRNLIQWLDTQGKQNFSADRRTWYDLSGNGNHALVPAGWDTPALVTDPVNGLPAIQNTTPQAGFKTRFASALPPNAFLFQVVNVRNFGGPNDFGLLFDEVDNNFRYGIYLNDSRYKLAKGGNYGDYTTKTPGLRTLAFDGQNIADNGTVFEAPNSFFGSQVVNGLTYGNSAGGGAQANALLHTFLVYSALPTDDELAQLVRAAKHNFKIS